MLTELLTKEVEKNFDESRIEITINFDNARCLLIRDVSMIEKTASYAVEDAHGATHAKINIRDNTQSYIYDYDLESDALTYSDEIPGRWKRPFLEEDKLLEEEEKEAANRDKRHRRRQLKALLIGTLPLLVYAVLAFYYVITTGYPHVDVLIVVGMFYEACVMFAILVWDAVHRTLGL